MTERPVKDWVAMFVPLAITAHLHEAGAKGEGLNVPAFEHEGFVGEAHKVTGIPEDHRCVTIEPGRRCAVFATREEAEAFVAAQTVRQSGWMVVART